MQKRHGLDVGMANRVLTARLTDRGQDASADPPHYMFCATAYSNCLFFAEKTGAMVWIRLD